jgi:flavorubredoxin
MDNGVPRPEGLPRELVPNVVWLGSCLENPYQGEILHSYQSLFLIKGEDAACLVEAGFPSHASTVQEQLDEALAGGPPLRYIFPTHQEMPHAGGVGRFLERYPDSVAFGDVRDYHLFFPHLADRFVTREVGEQIDLGGLHIKVVDAVIKDLVSTRWLVVPELGALFTGDGFSFAHYHEAGQCGKVASELPDLNVAGLGSLFIEVALHWLRFVDPEVYVEALGDCLAEHDVEFIGPTHGLPITDVPLIMPHIYEGLRRAVDAAEA